MEHLADKVETKSFTKSELDFFKTHRDFKKNYLKWIRDKHGISIWSVKDGE